MPDRRRLKLVAAAIAALALGGPAVALALTPKKGHYAQCVNRSGAPASCATRGNLIVTQFDYKLHKIYHFRHFDKCAPVPLTPGIPAFKVTARTGSFKYHAFRSDVIRNRFEITITGRFVTATKATGKATYRKVRAGRSTPRLCKTTSSFVVKRVGTFQTS